MTRIKAFLLFSIVRILIFTYRVRYLDSENRKKFQEETNYGYLYALWHQNLISGLASEMDTPHSMVVSASKDGELVAVACEMLGHHPVRGSSHRGGASALKAIIKKVRTGLPGAITVDGPKGPSLEAKKGIFELSLVSKAPIIPIMPLALNFWCFKKSWDQFRVPKPFSKIIVWHGEPITVTKADKENQYKEVSENLRHQLIEAEQNIKNGL